MNIIALVAEMIVEHGPIAFVDGQAIGYTLDADARHESWGAGRLYTFTSDLSQCCVLTGNRAWPIRRDFRVAAVHVLRCGRSTRAAQAAARSILQALLADSAPIEDES